MGWVVKLEVRPSMAATPGMRAWRTVRLPEALSELFDGLAEAERDPDADPHSPELLAARSTAFNEAFDSVAPHATGDMWLLCVHGREGDRFFPLRNVVQFMIRREEEERPAEADEEVGSNGPH